MITNHSINHLITLKISDDLIIVCAADTFNGVRNAVRNITIHIENHIYDNMRACASGNFMKFH